MRAVVLLRGVNVGGVRFPMKELAARLMEAGFTDVRTVLASGNVVLTGDQDDARAIGRAVSGVIRQAFGFDVAAIALPMPLVATAVDEYPFDRAPDRHAYVVFAERPDALAALLESAGALDPAVERVQPGEGVLYWDAPKGETLTTAFGRHYGGQQRTGVVTTRNLNTLEKILAGEDRA
ncbi:DUF1697 domain-containing protein [Amnibacterium sp. CER49]|uniref:DUF1697 domain-containing protein n=1 Tax=Amnibacterium sp. CER49 TaxID=3039161 RepID=UPI002449E7FE|nr:DUF1697 domain-containing protein [Amnibacterium sp. CER49]MDH2444201.1 DUF1697 domain-containing protein [Amnibacterium sp. CER49]